MRAYNLLLGLLSAALCLLAAGCDGDRFLPETPDAAPETERVAPVHRAQDSESRHVVLLYSAGFNSLSSDLLTDIKELCAGFLPGHRRYEDVLLVFSHAMKSPGRWQTATEPVLMRVLKDEDGQVVRDTLVRFATTDYSGKAETLNKVLCYVKEYFPAKSYGLVVSSHASGWTPPGYYSNPGAFEGSSPIWDRQRNHRIALTAGLHPVSVPEGYPRVKSVCQDLVSGLSREMSIQEFAAAIPMHMDYILMDCCLMGCVEVAWELKDVCTLLGASPTEVLSDGFDYKQLGKDLFGGAGANPEAVCRHYFQLYENKHGLERSATITLMDLSRIDSLGRCCKRLIEAHRDGLAALDATKVQRYYRKYRHYFYDLEDMFIQAGADESEKRDLAAALAWCTPYRDATPSFLTTFSYPDEDGFPIDHYSGYSMYMPADGTAYLNNYYKTLSWNVFTGLVE